MMQAKRTYKEIEPILKDLLKEQIFKSIGISVNITAEDLKSQMGISINGNRKKRNAIPYREILEYCNKQGIEPLTIFYKQEINEIANKT